MLIDKYKSYGFRVKEDLPFTNGDIRTLFFKAPKIFKLLAKGDLKQVQSILSDDSQLDDLLDRWVTWNTQREEENQHDSVFLLRHSINNSIIAE